MSVANRALVRPLPVDSQAGGQRLFDVLIGTLMMVVALPVVSIAWAIVRLTSAGPGFYTQTRACRFGRPFRIVKLRTMYHPREAAGRPWPPKPRPQVTPVGRVLRWLYIDRLPQVWNVLRGEMSVVGPRPERPEIAGPLSRMLPGYGHRLRVRPGLTGLSQVQLPAATDLGSVRRQLVLDRWYVARRSVWLDARLVALAGLTVCGLPGAVACKVGRLPDPLVASADAVVDIVLDGVSAAPSVTARGG